MPLYTALLEQALTEGNNEVVNYFCLSKPILADTSHSKFCKDFLTSINFLTLTAFAAFKGFRISFEKQKGEPDIYDCYKAIEVRTEGEDLEKLLKSLYKEYKPFYDKALIYCMYNKKDLLDSISYLPGAQETIDKFLKKPKATLPIAIPAANNTSPSSSPSTTGLYFPQNQNLNEELSTGAEVVYGQR